MAKVYALMKLVHDDQSYEIGDPVELPRNSDQEKFDYDRMIAQGMVSPTAPKSDKDDQPAGRTGRDRAKE